MHRHYPLHHRLKRGTYLYLGRLDMRYKFSMISWYDYSMWTVPDGKVLFGLYKEYVASLRGQVAWTLPITL